MQTYLWQFSLVYLYNYVRMLCVYMYMRRREGFRERERGEEEIQNLNFKEFKKIKPLVISIPRKKNIYKLYCSLGYLQQHKYISRADSSKWICPKTAKTDLLTQFCSRSVPPHVQLIPTCYTYRNTLKQ